MRRIASAVLVIVALAPAASSAACGTLPDARGDLGWGNSLRPPVAADPAGAGGHVDVLAVEVARDADALVFTMRVADLGAPRSFGATRAAYEVDFSVDGAGSLRAWAVHDGAWSYGLTPAVWFDAERQMPAEGLLPADRRPISGSVDETRNEITLVVPQILEPGSAHADLYAWTQETTGRPDLARHTFDELSREWQRVALGACA